MAKGLSTTQRTIKFFIPHRLPGLNEMIAAAKIRIKKGSLYDIGKKQHTGYVAAIIGQFDEPLGPVFINFLWQEQNRRRDKDNVAVARKYILDGMVLAGLLAGDGWKHVEGWTDSFAVDKKNPGVLVEVTEI